MVGFVILALVAVLALLLDGFDLEHFLSSVGRASVSPGTLSPQPTTPSNTVSTQDADPRSTDLKTRSVPSGHDDSEIANSGVPQEHASPPHEDAQPQPTQDDWIDDAEEVLDEAERIYKVSVGKGKEWWGRVGGKKNGKSKAKQGKKKDGR